MGGDGGGRGTGSLVWLFYTKEVRVGDGGRVGCGARKVMHLVCTWWRKHRSHHIPPVGWRICLRGHSLPPRGIRGIRGWLSVAGGDIDTVALAVGNGPGLGKASLAHLCMSTQKDR